VQITRVSNKGQIVIPKSIRASRAWGPGTELAVEETEAGVLLRSVQRFPATKLHEVAGCLAAKRKAKTLKEMRAAAARETIRRHERGKY